MESETSNLNKRLDFTRQKRWINSSETTLVNAKDTYLGVMHDSAKIAFLELHKFTCRLS